MKGNEMKASEQVKQFLAACKEYGFSWETCGNNVLRIRKKFTPNDKEAFTFCDMFGPSCLALVPLKGGSVWGTDGGSVGGYSGLRSGEYILNKSGTAARFMKELTGY
jgi:hypothetical protein